MWLAVAMILASSIATVLNVWSLCRYRARLRGLSERQARRARVGLAVVVRTVEDGRVVERNLLNGVTLDDLATMARVGGTMSLFGDGRGPTTTGMQLSPAAPSMIDVVLVDTG